VFVVLDTSRSMLASEGSGEPTRYERARDEAIDLQSELGDVPVGLASFTDRVLAHLFPTVDERAFRDTAVNSMGIERPPPSTSFGTNVTTLDALGVVPTLNLFTPGVKRRALVVFTDGESQPISGALSSDFARKPLVHVTLRPRRRHARTHLHGRRRGGGYKSYPTSSATLTAAASAVHGRIVPLVALLAVFPLGFVLLRRNA
jgi:von Willebrand factor type A domain